METTVQSNTVNGITINTRNRRSARELVNTEGDLQIIRNPKTNKLFFKSGEVQGYISPKAVKALQSDCKLDDLKVADVQIPSKSDAWIPTLMVVGNSADNVVRTLRADD